MTCYVEQGYTQRTLAEALTRLHPDRPVTQAMVSHWCHLADTGRAFPKYQTMLEIAEVLGASVAYLTGEIDANTVQEEQVCDYTGLLPQAVRSLRLATQREDDPKVNLNEDSTDGYLIECLEDIDNPSMPLEQRIRTVPRYLSGHDNARARSMAVSRFLAAPSFRNELAEALEQVLDAYTTSDATGHDESYRKYLHAERQETQARYQASESLTRIMDQMTDGVNLPIPHDPANTVKMKTIAEALKPLANALRATQDLMNELRASAHNDPGRCIIPTTPGTNDPFGLHQQPRGNNSQPADQK